MDATVKKAKACKQCKARFVSYNHRQQFCSRKCAQAGKNKPLAASVCECCGSAFMQKYTYSKTKTCSRKCWAKMRSEEYSDGRMKEIRRLAQLVLDKKFAKSRQAKRRQKENWEIARYRCCGWCFTAFKAIARHQVYCTNESCKKDRAAGKQRISAYWSRPANRGCIGCGEEYGRDRSNKSKYCSDRCSKNAGKKRRARRICSTESDSVGTLFIAKKFGFTCCKCGVKCKKPSKKNLDCEATIDHVIPVALGGRHIIKNMQLLCRRCNIEKGTNVNDYRKAKA